MELNVTIFIQITNFWITYWILHRFFLKPVVAFVQQKECALAMVQDKLKHKEVTIQALQKNKHAQLLSFKNHLKNDYQMIELASDERHIQALNQPGAVIDKEDAIKQCKQVITKKVCDACSCSDM